MSIALTSLPPEPWGSKFRRAREEVAGLATLDDARQVIDDYMLTSTASLSRLENYPCVPADKRRRQMAYVACVLYGVDPAELDLTPADVPRGLGLALHERGPAQNWKILIAWPSRVGVDLVAAVALARRRRPVSEVGGSPGGFTSADVSEARRAA